MARKKDNKIRWPLILAFGILVCIMIAVFVLISEAPSRTVTADRFGTVASRVLAYASANNKMPTRLSDLPQRQGHDNEIVDEWNHEISYTVQNDGTVILTSYGKDGRPGGNGEDGYIIGSFKPRDEDGKWASQVNWIVSSRRAPD